VVAPDKAETPALEFESGIVSGKRNDFEAGTGATRSFCLSGTIAKFVQHDVVPLPFAIVCLRRGSVLWAAVSGGVALDKGEIVLAGTRIGDR
jgi:hypothetical protein